jgi:hypothetical protein
MLLSGGEKENLFDLGYMGTYSEDRQETLERLMLMPAGSGQRGNS